ncbi:Nn.00g028220.m01.CDS01 [Neocucurbitaria sp. VM-36]
MLERASTCLESGGRQLFRAPKQCLRSRRMLHSHFWHHGASDLSLPIWWAASTILDPSNGDVDDRVPRATGGAASRHHEGALLDFLYPEKTLALLRRLSTHGRDVSESRRRQLSGSGTRHFSTTRGQPRHDEASVDAAVTDEVKREMETRLKDSNSTEELKKVLRTREPGKQELAWQLYSTIPEDQLAGRSYLRGDLLAYLANDDSLAAPSRVLQVFGDIPIPHRRPSSYRAAIVAYIALRMVGPAIQILEEVPRDRNFDMSYIGIDVILRRTVFDEQWDLCLRVFRAFLRQTPALQGLPIGVQIRRGNTLPDVWKEITHLPILLENLQSFLAHVREFQHELRSSKEQEETLSCFVMTFIPHVMDRVLDVRRPDEPVIWKWFMTLFDDLHSLNLPTSACYEYAIKKQLELPQYQAYTNKRQLWQLLYQRYRQQFIDNPESNFGAMPSRNIIRQLIFRVSRDNSLKQMREYVQDLRTFYPGQPLGAGLLKILIQTFANRGEDDLVHEYFREFQSNYKEQIDLKVLSSLLFVYARRADVDGAIFQFRRLHDEFGLVPNISCWNILLLAYVRADDLDGALECFNNCLDCGLMPDKLTFGPILDFCASRGDVEAFEALFARAKQMGIRLDADVRARSGYVQAFLNAGDAEGAEAIARGMLRSWQAGTLRGHPLTHTWNLLIQHHALHRDIASSRQCYKQMVENNIPLDSWTYGSLMRALVEVRQTNAAYKILRVTMPEKDLRVHAFHYAIVMAGFLREGQVDLAMDAYDGMTKRQVPQTESSRQASLQTLGAAELARLKKRKAKDPKYSLLKVEEALQEMLVAGAGSDAAHREPRHQRQFDVHNYGAVPQAYRGLLISLYTSRRAYAICRKLFKKAEEAAPDADNYATSITLTTAIMEAHLGAGRHAEVARCWALARASAGKLTKTFHQAVHPQRAVPEFDSLVDPSVSERFEQSHISTNRRHILFKASRVYIRSLLQQTDPAALQEAQRTIRDLLVNGFTVDNFTWNEFIQQLALRGRLVDAFTTCEEYLMPRFPGWRNLAPNYVRNNREGYQWMEIRHYDIKKTSVMPRYKTLVILAKTYGQTRKDERNGVGYDVSAGAWMREILEQAAPMTIRAIETMPVTNDKLQERYFHNV